MKKEIHYLHKDLLILNNHFNIRKDLDINYLNHLSGKINNYHLLNKIKESIVI